MSVEEVLTKSATESVRYAPRGFVRMLLIAFGVCLWGYAFLGRGFAYLGYPPLYVDAVLWSLAVAYLFLRPNWLDMLREPVVCLLLSFMIWGALRTFPYLEVYGINALRDGVLWGYGVFALAIGYLVFRLPLERSFISYYATYILWFPLWAPVAFLLYWLSGEILPRFPWGPEDGVAMIHLKGGDIAVHLAGILAFWLAIQPYWRHRGIQVRYFWLGWLFGFALVGFTGRAAFMVFATTLFFLAFHVKLSRWANIVVLVGLLLLTFATFGLVINVSEDRKVSVEQLVINLASIVGEADGFSGEGSKMWRLAWWGTIISYTLEGEYFWTGKGFGINLADDDGFQAASDGSLRSPHNGHLTILARAGFPGLALWLLFLSVLLARLWQSYRRWGVHGEYLQAGLRLWTMSYLLAGIVNGAFDVYLEGPQGGVWFWSCVGFGLGLLLKDSTGSGRYGKALLT